MSSEALLENPKLFCEDGDRLYHENYIKSQIDTAKEYIQLVRDYSSSKSLYIEFRGHMFKILFRFLDAPKNKDIQKTLADGNFAEMAAVVDVIEQRLQTSTGFISVDEAIHLGLLSTKSWYYRHRDDTASNRILSVRRVKGSSMTPRPENINSDSKEALQKKLSDLKTRLSLKHNLK
jgi:hypothetical protein